MSSDFLLMLAGSVMGILAWRMALRDPQVDFWSAILTAGSLTLMTGVYVGEGLILAALSGVVSTSAWCAISWRNV